MRDLLIVAIDPKHLPEDPKTLQQMILDLMAQLDREFTERGKIETLLRELLDARRNRKSEQLSTDQLALFAAAWQARQAAAEPESSAGPDDEDDDCHRRCLQEIRLRLHSQDCDQTTTADRKRHRWRQPAGTGNCQQIC